MKKEELKVCGVNAARALWLRRRADVLRVYLVEDKLKDFGWLLKWCAGNKKPYHLVPSAELEKVAETVHHEGICIVARPKSWTPLEALLKGLGDRPARLLVLEGVENPHNLGAIARVAAHFGAQGMILIAPPDGKRPPSLSTAVHRTAEGGLEWLELVQAHDPGEALERLREAGIRLYASAGKGEGELYRTAIAPRAAFLFGAEGVGLSGAAQRAADAVLRIPGTGQVESLNVATATAVVLGEVWRADHAARPERPRGKR